MKKILVCCLLVCCLCACGHGEESKNETGMDVTAEAALTGTPDPIPHEIYPDMRPNSVYDPSTLQVYATCPSYSISEDKYAYITVLDTAEERQLVPMHHIVNIERWTGEAWQRLTYSPSLIVIPDVWPPVPYVWSGVAEERAIELACVREGLTPGRYRAVLYVGYDAQDEPYQRVYAEFELIK